MRPPHPEKKHTDGPCLYHTEGHVGMGVAVSFVGFCLKFPRPLP